MSNGRLALDGQEQLVQVPRIARLRAPTVAFVGRLLPELARPTTNGFIPEDDAASRQYLFDIGDPSGEAQGKPNGEPHGMRDNLGRIAMTLGGWRSNVRLHAERIAYMPAVSADPLT